MKSECSCADESGASISPSVTTGAVLQSTAHEDAPVLAMGGKRLRMTAAELLESEGDASATDLEEFVDRMESMNVEAGSDDWKDLWKEHAERNLKERDPAGWAEYERRRLIETSTQSSARSPSVDPPGGGKDVPENASAG